ncbi:Superoxide dismutase 1 copper chaperone [Escovopsis weberi]|uniref:Superoxide dismutase 1 copper chaperone n=1 Tax=Escovopsis weberi TaxID=150374 RepID=A0A0M8N1L7_ESCWE|nr:Superoxide dismutase 1 copper chaperone [Escovopsis weberi]
MAVPHTFQTLFAVPLSCDGCVKSVSDALYRLGGITRVEANLQDQLISVQGSVAPSAIVQTIQETGKDAILRGSGASNSAAVSILETYAESIAREASADPDRAVRGLARMVQVSPERTLVDLTVRGVSPGTYRATIREYGNLAEGAASAGPVWRGTAAAAGAASGPGSGSGSGSGSDFKGCLGEVQVAQDGRGSAFADHGFQIWEAIGHALVLTRQEEREGGRLANDEDTVVGVIARSAGVWENDKTVCSCTGKTLWEERRDEVQKGML